MDNIIRIGTRRSKLALWQATHVADLLKKQGAQAEIVAIETTGDKVLNKSIAKIGSKGVFTEELEQMLHSGDIDIAVHSAKDLPSSLPEGLGIIAFTERESPEDVVVSYNRFLNFEDTSQKLVMGTSSTRRAAFIKHYYPKVRIVEVRGNLQTRMEKMKEGLCDGLMLAYAGVHRMGYEQHIITKMPMDKFTPQAGQGTLAVEAAERLDKKSYNLIRKAVNHVPTENRSLAERGYLRRIDGGCSIPGFVIAHETSLGELHLHGGIIRINGKEVVRKDVTGAVQDAEALGATLGEQVLQGGGAEILAEIREESS